MIMSKKSGKVKVPLYTGPFRGHSVKLSRSKAVNEICGVTSTLMFAVGEDIGQYVDGRWKPYDNPAVLNNNIVLGDN
jgi:hypothetical protein